MKSVQLTLLSQKKYSSRKTVRPIHLRGWNHVTLKARTHVLRAHHLLVRKIIREGQLRFGVRLKSIAILENHIHLLITPHSRDGFANFMRYVAGQIATKVGRGKLWLQRCWSRGVNWGRDLQGVAHYIERNPSKAGCFGSEDLHVIRNGILEIRPGPIPS